MNVDYLMVTPSWQWPADADATLLAILEDHNAPARERVEAAELAGDIVVINDELVDALLRIVADGAETEELRGTAAIALGPVLEQTFCDGFDDPFDDALVTESTFHTIQRTLRALYRDDAVPTYVRRRILEAAVRAPEDWHTDAVRAAYHSDDESWQLTAVFCMQHIRGFDAEIEEALHSRNRDIEYEAVVAAATWGVSAAWPVVLRLLTTARDDRSLLLAAIEAVASVRPDEAAGILYDLREEVDDEEVDDAIREALAIYGPMPDDDEFDTDGNGRF